MPVSVLFFCSVYGIRMYLFRTVLTIGLDGQHGTETKMRTMQRKNDKQANDDSRPFGCAVALKFSKILPSALYN